jgi:polysaccharide biosynthesis/export protein
MKIAGLIVMSAVILLSPGPARAQAPNGATVPPLDASRTASKTAPTAPTAADYRLMPGDKLRVEVYKDTQLSQSLQVRPDGKITLPLAGDISAAGRTPLELRDGIVDSLKAYISNPVVTVIVVETMPKMVYVVGEVNSPGPHPMPGPTTVLQALALAGGFKDFAKKNDIVIRRSTTTGTTDIRFNYKDALKGETKPLLLQHGDTIIVP